MIQKNYKGDIKVFDQIEAEALEMADMISQAIVMQFLICFRSRVPGYRTIWNLKSRSILH